MVWSRALLLWLVLFVPTAAVAADVRVALVIGNSAYDAVGLLPNPRRDAAFVAETLRDEGFAVTLVEDATRVAMLQALNDFNDRADQADWALVYYAGHGMEVGGINYLLPTDVRLKTDRGARDEAVSLDRVLDAVANAKKLRLVVLDACRENPFAATMKPTVASRRVDRGLAPPDPQAGILVVYAAAAGAVAADGAGEHSPFTSALVNRMKEPGLEIGRVFDKVARDVLDATRNRQRPFAYGSNPSLEAFYFVPPAPALAAAPDERFWGLLKTSTDAATLRAFRDGLPAASPLRGEVEARLGALGQAVAALPIAPRPTAPAGPPPVDAATAAAIAACDRLAALSYDPTLPPGVRGRAAPKSGPEAVAACRVAVAARPGEARYKLQLALSFGASGGAEALELLRAAASGGSLTAQTCLGVQLALGNDAAQHPEGVRLVLDAAEKNLPFAQNMAAMGYSTGYGVAKDPIKALFWLRRSADGGLPQAMVVLGQTSLGVDPSVKELLAANHVAADPVEGLRWLARAEQTRDPMALQLLGRIYLEGQGVPADPARAVRLYKQAVAAGDAESAGALAMIYREGKGVPRDPAEALRWQRRRVELGDSYYAAAAAKDLATTYEEGKDVARDPAEALMWLRKAGDLGDGEAARTLAARYREGKDVVRDPAEALRWLRKAGEAGDDDAMKKLASTYLDGTDAPPDPDEGVRWLRKAAGTCCDAESVRSLASLYREGRFVKKDPDEAMRWFRKAAEGPMLDMESVKALATMYLDGEGVARNDEEAFRWFMKAAEGADAPSMERVAMMYEAGQGVGQDADLAQAWYRKAAGAGQVSAMRRLGDLYAAGKTVPRDNAKARTWYGQAAEAGDAEARTALSRLPRVKGGAKP